MCFDRCCCCCSRRQTFASVSPCVCSFPLQTEPIRRSLRRVTSTNSYYDGRLFAVYTISFLLLCVFFRRFFWVLFLFHFVHYIISRICQWRMIVSRCVNGAYGMRHCFFLLVSLFGFVSLQTHSHTHTLFQTAQNSLNSWCTGSEQQQQRAETDTGDCEHKLVHTDTHSFADRCLEVIKTLILY